jgi:hypothetical protein
MSLPWDETVQLREKFPNKNFHRFQPSTNVQACMIRMVNSMCQRWVGQLAKTRSIKSLQNFSRKLKKKKLLSRPRRRENNIKTGHPCLLKKWLNPYLVYTGLSLFYKIGARGIEFIFQFIKGRL